MIHASLSAAVRSPTPTTVPALLPGSFDAPGRERVGHAASTCPEFAIRVAMYVALDAAGNDLLRTVVALGMRKQCRNQQRLLHH
jgi:hypothetical protein